MAEILGGNLQTERMPVGTRRLTEPLVVRSRGHVFVIPDQFETDFSSYPRALIIIMLAVFLTIMSWSPMWAMLLLLIPRYSRTDLAGVVHDWLILTQPVSWFESILIWVDVALSGYSRVWFVQAIAGFLGLFIGSGPLWVKYKRKINDPATLALIERSLQTHV